MAEDPNKPSPGSLRDKATPAKNLDELKAKTRALGVESQKAGQTLTKLSTTAGSVFDAFGEGLDLSIKGLITFALKIDQARADMSKLTGAAEGLGAAMSASREHTQGLAIRYEELSKYVTTAYQSIAIFSEESKKSQGAMLGATAALTKLGVSGEVTAKNLNSLTKGLGMTGEGASKVTMDLAKVAKSLGSFMTPGKIAQEFSNALPKLAAYGKGATREFYKLAGQAKATGLEIGTLLGVAGKFDTFEDAANNTAQLNALLGTQLNSVDMLTASDEERLMMMKENFDQTGKSWEGLDRFEKKALAQASGFEDMQKAAQYFGTSMEDIQEAQEAADPALVSQNELNDAMKKGVSLQEQWAAMLEGIKFKLAKIIMPHVMKFFNWMTGKDLAKGAKSPIDYMVEAITDFAGLVEKYVITPMSEFWGMMDEEDKQTTANIMGIVLALTPIIGIVLAIIGPLTTVFSVIGSILSVGATIVGVVFSPIGIAIALVVGAFALLAATFYKHWEGIKREIFVPMVGWFNEVVDLIGGKLQETWDNFVSSWPRLAGAILYVKEFMTALFEDVWSSLKEGSALIGNFMAEMINNSIVVLINDSLGALWDNLPGPIKKLLPEGWDTPPQIPPIPKLHEGGELLGPAIVKSDEYVIMPPANAPAGQVLTPQQMGNTDDKPVTVVINIDGREFVRQTVFPVLNKEFNLQGIG